MSTSNKVAKAVDLGLSVKWASWNIGASSEKEYGSYIAWGDPTGENESYINSDYPYSATSDNQGLDIAGSKYDTATSLWGEGWKMPTDAEWKELDTLEKTIVTLSNGVKAFKVTASNGNYIYLPCGGWKSQSKGNINLQDENIRADYWTSINTSGIFAQGVTVGKVNCTYESEDQKGWHMLIRPVYKKSSSGGTGNSLTDAGKQAKAVDLGLSVKWATYNLGTTNSTEAGYYFAWGETTPRTDNFDLGHYKWYDASTGKYNIPNTVISYTSNDAAYKLWGGTWRMPTEAEMNELISKCTWTKTDGGFRIQGPNGNEIFLPFTGMYNSDGLNSDTKCFYWSGSYNDLPLHAEDYWAYYLSTYTSNSETAAVVISQYIYHGLCIRPVTGGDLTPDVTPDPTPTPTPDPDTPDSGGGDSDGDSGGNDGGSTDNPDTPDVPDTPDEPTDDNNNVSKDALTITDTYDIGYSVDPNVILYAGGQEVIPKVMAQKDNTLFLGNFKESTKVLDQETLDLIKNNVEVKYDYFTTGISKGETGSLYMYENQLGKSSYEIASFKGGEVYRFGLVFQNRRGEWSDVAYVGDYQNDKYPNDAGTYFKAPKAYISLTKSVATKLYEMGYRKAKAVVVYPSINNRLVVCQGVMCPTVYNINSRKNNAPYAMSSWFYREMHSPNVLDVANIKTQNKHNFNIYNDINDYVAPVDRVFPSSNTYLGTKSALSQFKAEISCASIDNIYAYYSDDPQNMYVDWNTVTMNTPEVDFSIEGTASTIPTEGLKLRIIGIIPLTSNANDIYVNTSTQPMRVASFTGLHNTNENNNNINVEDCALRLTKFDWYDYNYFQKRDGSDWDVDKQYFDAIDTTVTNITLPNKVEHTFTKGIYKDHRVYPTYPWQGAKSLLGQYRIKNGDTSSDDKSNNNVVDGIYFSALNKKCISNIRTSAFTYYFPEKAISYDIGNVGLYSGDIPLAKLSKDKHDGDHTGVFNYYGEVNTILSPKDYYQIYSGIVANYSLSDYNQGTLKDVALVQPIGKTNDAVRIKYKSSPHLACHLNYTEDGKQELLPKFKLRGFTFGNQEDNAASTTGGKYYIAGWSDKISNKTSNSIQSSTEQQLHQNTIELAYPTFSLFNVTQYMTSGYMYIGEFYKEIPKDGISSLFGGTTSMAFEKNQWHTAGPAETIKEGEDLSVYCLQGDTYYQRYDSMKTYPYTDEDPNQIVEILSFMCETRMNIDGRYDNNRGLSSNLYMNRVNFNLFNPAYTQQDNYFSYYFLDPERNSEDTYPNSFLWSKSKTMGEEVDTWSNINSASTYSLDGDKGDLSALVNWNDTLLSFQENGIAKIMYNDRIQVSTSDGNPIELSNSAKVSGKQYMSTTIGCSNRRTIQITPKGIYFMDSNSKDLYIIGNGIDSLSKAKGFNSYFYNKDISKFKTFYDEKASDVYFIDTTDCLDFSESLNEFEGFYDYGGVDYMFNYGDSFISIKNNTLWKQYAGDYNVFFDEYKPFWLTLISNEGNSDKTFNNIEFEADSWNSDNTLADTTFDHLSIWDEYQMGEAVLRTLNVDNHYHFSNLKRKFRIWRANIPRELKLKNITYPDALKKMQAGDVDENTGKILNMTEGLNRIRNTWAYIRLLKYKENKGKTILHGIKVGYFN